MTVCLPMHSFKKSPAFTCTCFWLFFAQSHPLWGCSRCRQSGVSLFSSAPAYEENIIRANYQGSLIKSFLNKRVNMAVTGFLQRKDQSHLCRGISLSSRGKQDPPEVTKPWANGCLFFNTLNHTVMCDQRIFLPWNDPANLLWLRRVRRSPPLIHTAAKHMKSTEARHSCWRQTMKKKTLLCKPGRSVFSRGHSWWGSSSFCSDSPPEKHE